MKQDMEGQLHAQNQALSNFKLALARGANATAADADPEQELLAIGALPSQLLSFFSRVFSFSEHVLEFLSRRRKRKGPCNLSSPRILP